MRRAVLALLPAIGVAAVAAPSAWGHAFYVDAAAAPGGSCQVGDPCKTIAEAMALQDPDEQSPDVIVVSPGSYTENVYLAITPEVPFADRSLLASGVGDHVILPADPAQPTVKFGPGTAANVVGFEIGGPEPVRLAGPGRVSGNAFDAADLPDGGASVKITQNAGDAVVDRNTFAGDGTGTSFGLRSLSEGSPVIRENAFVGMPTAIGVLAGSPTIESDLVSGAETAIAASAATVNVVNLTATGNSTDLALQDADLTLTSSFVEQPIAADATSSCAVAYSAGPTTAGTPCETFQLPNTAPGFADPAGGDYHPTSSSPLVDAGDPLLLSGIDLDGNSRVADGNCDGASVRDIGAVRAHGGVPAAARPPARPAATADRPARHRYRSTGDLNRARSR